MRARQRRRWPGWGPVAAGVYAVLVAVAVVQAVGDDARDRDPGGDAPGEAVALRFVDAWRTSRIAVFVATGTFERSAEATGARLESEAFLAQDPPRRLQRELGGVQGRDDDRLLLCPVLPDGDTGRCRLGEPSGTSYAEAVEAEVQALATHVLGPEPVYEVTEEGAGCFALRQRRPEPAAAFGYAARFCFDPGTGAPVEREVQFEGGVVERVVYTEIRREVTDRDFEV